MNPLFKLTLGSSLLVACYSVASSPAGDGTRSTSAQTTSSAAGGSSSATTNGGAGGGTGIAGGAPTTDPCAGYTAPGDPADIAASPREDGSAEILAFEATNSVVAPAWAYDRIHADLAAIRAAGPAALADIHADASVYWLAAYVPTAPSTSSSTTRLSRRSSRARTKPGAAPTRSTGSLAPSSVT